MNTSILAVLALLVGWSGNSPSADGPLRKFDFTEAHMGTRCRIMLYALNETKANAGAKAAFARIAELEAIMSDYKPTSELMRLCQKAGGEAVPVSAELFHVLQYAQNVSVISDGAFDVTVGPVVRLWRQARKTQQLPDAKKLADARARVGYRYVWLDPGKRTVQLLKGGMQLDLGGIAKGYAADEALRTLKMLGIDRALVAMGGDIGVSDAPPDTAGWRVGIASLENPNEKPSRFVILKHQAVSTSGDAEQHVEIDGKRYSHIVDPRTGMGLLGQRSVSIVAPSGIQSDSFSKIASVMDSAQSLPILQRIEGVHFLISRKTDKGDFSLESDGFKKLEEGRESR